MQNIDYVPWQFDSSFTAKKNIEKKPDRHIACTVWQWDMINCEKFLRLVNVNAILLEAHSKVKVAFLVQNVSDIPKTTTKQLFTTSILSYFVQQR